MIKFLKTILESKKYSLSSEIKGMTHPKCGKINGIKWVDLVTYLESRTDLHNQIGRELSTIQYQKGDVTQYLVFLANEMIDTQWFFDSPDSEQVESKKAG